MGSVVGVAAVAERRQPDTSWNARARENPVVVASQSSPREVSPESVRRGASPVSGAGRGNGSRGDISPSRHRRDASK